MPAIITDQFRILNAETFVNSFAGVGIGTTNQYYSFLGHPNPTNDTIDNYGDNDWSTVPPEPKDSFKNEYGYHDSMLFLKKITSDDVARIIPRFDWQSGSTYDMYKDNYDIDYKAPQLSASTLYEAKYIIVNSEYKVYLCIHNGSNPENPNGRKSLVEPNFISTIPQTASVNAQDGYIWKYLFTIPVSDVIKFATTKYVPLPKQWGDTNTLAVKDAAVDGQLETIVIKNRGTNYLFTGGPNSNTLVVPVYGDGSGGQATIVINNGEIASAEISARGQDYTRAFIRVTANVVGENLIGGNPVSVSSGSGAIFEIPVPPKGGHGANIYRECGAHRVMVYSKYATQDDYVIGNTFSRIGIVKNPTAYGSNQVIELNTATALGALKLLNPSIGEYPNNEIIQQTVGVGSTAVAYVASFDNQTGVLRYYQPTGLSTSAAFGYKLLEFSNSSTAGISSEIRVGVGTILNLDTSFTGDSETIGGKLVQFGQTFTAGIAPPEVEKYSGEIIYIDNRPPITRSKSQKEELKIVVEF